MNNAPICNQNILEVKQLFKDFKLGEVNVNALRGINLNISTGLFYSINGPSGSGKSSLLHILGCLDKPTSGEVYFKGKCISNLKDKDLTQIRAKEIGFVFQNFQLNPILSAIENISIALRVTGVSKSEAKKRSLEMLSKVGLSDRKNHYPNQLSGGQRQRVAIARALAKYPSLILADEPTGNLDSINSIEIVKLFRNLVNEFNTTVVVVTHNHEISDLTDIKIHIKDGILTS